MTRRFHTRSTPAQNLRIIVGRIPWRLLLLLPVLILLAIPTFYFGTHAGQNVLPALTSFFYKAAGDSPAPPATPHPSLPTTLPQVGSLLYTVLPGDSCDEILTYQMHMADAGTIFNDVQPATMKALDAATGQNCDDLQPGEVLTLSPHYPLVAFGGLVLKVVATSPQQVLPTPVIQITPQQQLGVDCSNGCLLTVRLASATQLYLNVQTTLPVKVGSWIWAQAMLERKKVSNFDSYPYADPAASLNGMTLSACDLQVDNTHDDNSLSCSQLLPNTITDDNGSWLFGATGSNALDHWSYPLHLAAGTQVLLWLSLDKNGNLYFQKGNPVYRYDEGSHLYVRV
jgi:hypothetical protein